MRFDQVNRDAQAAPKSHISACGVKGFFGFIQIQAAFLLQQIRPARAYGQILPKFTSARQQGGNGHGIALCRFAPRLQGKAGKPGGKRKQGAGSDGQGRVAVKQQRRQVFKHFRCAHGQHGIIGNRARVAVACA